MYVILSYDVSHNHQKFLYVIREYLFSVLESSFEGEMTQTQLEEMLGRIKPLLEEEDGFAIYIIDSKKSIKTISLGKKSLKDNLLL